jgi:hypothetical protein
MAEFGVVHTNTHRLAPTLFVSTKSPTTNEFEDGEQMLFPVSRAIPSVTVNCKGRRLFPHTLNSAPAYLTRSVSDDDGIAYVPFIALLLTRGLDLVQAQEVRHLASLWRESQLSISALRPQTRASCSSDFEWVCPLLFQQQRPLGSLNVARRPPTASSNRRAKQQPFSEVHA